MWLSAKVRSRPSAVTSRLREHRAGVVDEDVDARLRWPRSRRRRAAPRRSARDRRLGSGAARRARSRSSFASVASARLASRATKTMPRAEPRQLGGRDLADPRSGAGDDDGLALHGVLLDRFQRPSLRRFEAVLVVPYVCEGDFRPALLLVAQVERACGEKHPGAVQVCGEPSLLANHHYFFFPVDVFGVDRSAARTFTVLLPIVRV